jgi:hypothetical protein
MGTGPYPGQVADGSSVQLDPALAARLAAFVAARPGLTLARAANLLVDEALRSSAHPVVVFVDGPSGRRARLRGGPDVDRVIRALLATQAAEPLLSVDDILGVVGENSGTSVGMIRAAVEYWAEFPVEIDARLEEGKKAEYEARERRRSEQEEADEPGGPSATPLRLTPPLEPDASLAGSQRLLLDELLPVSLARQLVSLGVDCRSVADGSERCDPVDFVALGAETIAESALAEGRKLVTENVADFEALREQRTAVGRAMPDVLYVPDDRVLRNEGFLAEMAQRLLLAAAEPGLAGDNRPHWLD